MLLRNVLWMSGHNCYWLVQVEALQVLQVIDYYTLALLEQCEQSPRNSFSLANTGITDKVTRSILRALGDQDIRVREIAAETLVKVMECLPLVGKTKRERITSLAEAQLASVGQVHSSCQSAHPLHWLVACK